MKFIRFTILILCLLGVGSLSAQEFVKWHTPKVEHDGGGSFRILMKADIEPGWHMYDLQLYGDMGPNSTIFTFQPAEGLTLNGGVTSLQKARRVYDEVYQMEIGYYENSVTFVQKVTLTAPKATLTGEVEWMVCNDTACLPLDYHDISVEIVAPANTAAVVVPDPSPAPSEGLQEAQANDATETGDGEEGAGEQTAAEQTPSPEATAAPAGEPETAAAGPVEERSLWGLIIEAILWGFAALLTPCVFPMVPMTVSFFMKGSKSPAHGRFRAVMYGVFIVLLYTLPIAAIILITRFVGGDAVTADIFNWVATHWLPNILFFLVFMVFAASFFGAFEITLPSKLVNRSDKNADRGGLGGIFFMALTLVLVSFSCTGPIVGNVIIQSLSGQFWTPIITMLAFSIAFALPFSLVAIFPSLLDKMRSGSGGWLNSVKVVIAFIEVALGFKFLNMADMAYGWGLLDREVYLAIWIVVFSLLGLYLLGKIKFAHDSDVKHISVPRLALVIVTFSFVVYMIPGMWGAPLNALSGYLPPLTTQDFVIRTAPVSAVPQQADPHWPATVKYDDVFHLPNDLKGFFDLEQAEEYARKVGKPVFVDVTGRACVNCREMEQRVWSDPRVDKLLREEFVIVAIYVDDKKVELPESEWVTLPGGKVLKRLGQVNAHFVLETYNQNAQPYYAIQDSDRNILTQPKAYDLNVSNFVTFLEDGLKAYKERRK